MSYFFKIAQKVILFLSDRYEIVTTDWIFSDLDQLLVHFSDIESLNVKHLTIFTLNWLIMEVYIVRINLEILA